MTPEPKPKPNPADLAYASYCRFCASMDIQPLPQERWADITGGRGPAVYVYDQKGR